MKVKKCFFRNIWLRRFTQFPKRNSWNYVSQKTCSLFRPYQLPCSALFISRKYGFRPWFQLFLVEMVDFKAHVCKSIVAWYKMNSVCTHCISYMSRYAYLYVYIHTVHTCRIEYIHFSHLVVPASTFEFWFLFLHILNGRMATLPQTLPRSFRDLHFCFRESKFKTGASAK